MMLSHFRGGQKLASRELLLPMPNAAPTDVCNARIAMEVAAALGEVRRRAIP